MSSSLSEVADHLAHHDRRVLVDAVLDAWGGYWERRAQTFLDARPQPGDFTGLATREELSAAWQRLTVTAQACRARAQVSPLEPLEPEVDNVLSEAS